MVHYYLRVKPSGLTHTDKMIGYAIVTERRCHRLEHNLVSYLKYNLNIPSARIGRSLHDRGNYVTLHE